MARPIYRISLIGVSSELSIRANAKRAVFSWILQGEVSRGNEAHTQRDALMMFSKHDSVHRSHNGSSIVRDGEW